MLLLGFACVLRRIEIVALQLSDLEDAPGGIVVHVRKNKTGQEAPGQAVSGEAPCPSPSVAKRRV